MDECCAGGPKDADLAMNTWAMAVMIRPPDNSKRRAADVSGRLRFWLYKISETAFFLPLSQLKGPRQSFSIEGGPRSGDVAFSLA